MQKLYDAHRSKWDHLRNKNVFAVFFYFRLFALVKDENYKVYTIDSPIVNPLITPQHPDAAIFLKLARILE